MASFASESRAQGTVLLITFDGVDRATVVPPVGEEWFTGDAIPGSNRAARSLFGLLTGVSPVFVEGTTAEVPRHLLLGPRVGFGGGAAHLWVYTRDRERVRMLRGLTPELIRYRRLRAAVRDLEELAGEAGFFWVDVSEPMAARAANTVERMVRALGERSLMVVATTVRPDEKGRVPLWIRTPEPAAARSAGNGSGMEESPAIASLESVGTAMQAFLGLAPSPLASGAWPRHGVALGERSDDTGGLELTARRGGAEVRVAWQTGGLSACWLRSAAAGACHWTRAGQQKSVGGAGTGDGLPGSADVAEQVYRELENRLLWVLERRLD